MNPRTCIVTRTEKTPDEMVRFVLGPDLGVVPDLKRKLPGRGVWITSRKDLVEQAVKKNLFARGFKAQAIVQADLAEQVEGLLGENITGLLSMARKAGVMVSGQKNVEEQIKAGTASIILHATDKEGDGKRKIGQLAEQSERAPEIYEIFCSSELDRLTGRTNTAHLALKESGIAQKIGAAISRLASFRNQQ